MKPPQPPKSYRGYKIERYSRSFQVLFKATKGAHEINCKYSVTELKRAIDQCVDLQTVGLSVPTEMDESTNTPSSEATLPSVA